MKLARLALGGLWSALLLPVAAGIGLATFDPGIAAADDHPPAPLPHVHHIGTLPDRPNDAVPTAVVLEGTFPWPCGEIFDARVESPERVTLSMRETDACIPLPQWRQHFPLGILSAGNTLNGRVHTVEIELKVYDSATGANEPKVHVAPFSFHVAHADSVPPRPGLPYVRGVNIVPKDLEPPICGGDSIAVRISGAFPVACYELKEVQVVPSIIAVVGPPTVRLIVGKPPCPIDACPTVITPFSATVVLPGLPPSGYALPVEVEETICTASGEEQVVVHSDQFPFRVRDCGPPFQCLLGSFVRNNPNDRCDAAVGPDKPAQVTYAIQSPVALAGLEGSFRLHPRGLKIVDLEPVGPAQGMNLSWSNNPDGGASFVLFAEQGAPIPPHDAGTSPQVPVLRVTLEQTSATVPRLTSIIAESFGADADGNGVPHCPTLAPITAHICVMRQCDHNGDGRIDVRDLVHMVRCLNQEGSCSDLAVLDCTGNGEFDLDDVICCAFRILRRDCPDCPADTSRARPEPGVRYTIGEPMRGANGAKIPITIEGAGRLGGARLALGFPSSRYDVASVQLLGNPPNWLDLHEVDGGEILFGLIRTGPLRSQNVVEPPLEMMLELRLRDGQQQGGEVLTLESEFSGPDGATLDIDLARTTQPLAQPIGLALSPNRPDPFTTETVFSVTLAAAADVSIVVYDVSGRLVRSLHRGALGAGSHEMRWDGTSADGTRARRGIYFYRAVAGEQAMARKMILLERN